MDTAHYILVISADWQTRALLAAQIGEETGLNVMGAPGVDEALGLVKIAGVQPALFVVDAGSEMAAKDVERLLENASGVPLVLCVSALRRSEFDPLHERCTAYLTRPVSVGAIAQAAVRALQSHRNCSGIGKRDADFADRTQINADQLEKSASISAYLRSSAF